MREPYAARCPRRILNLEVVFRKREIHGTEIPQFAHAHCLPLLAWGGERWESLGDSSIFELL